MLRFLLMFFVVAVVACGSPEQKEAAATAEKMSDFTKDEEFKNAHPKPNAETFAPSGKMIQIETPDEGTASAYFLKAENVSDKYLIVFQEWWGLNDNIKREAEHYFNALNDVNVIAPDMYDGKVTDNPDNAGKLMQAAQKNPERLDAILQGVLNYAGDEPEVATIGWCFGGGLSLQASILAGESAAGCVMYYGMPVKTAQEIAPLETEVLGIFAKQDKWINEQVIQNFENLTAATGKKLNTVWFDADHAFANPSNPKYKAQMAKEANSMALDFLKKRL